MSAMMKEITASDILPIEQYAQNRAVMRQQAIALKRPRRIEIGPFATFYFENYDTMLAQVQEMLYIEKGGDAQLIDELEAYNPLIPQGAELTATLMFEIEDAVRRGDILRTLTDIELTAYIEVNGVKFFAKPEQDVERTAPDGKTSSVHFLHFPMSAAAIADFKNAAGKIIIGIEHKNYGHMTVLPPESQVSLAADFS